MRIKEFLKRLILKHNYNSDTFTQYLIKKGVTVGERTKFFSPSSLTIDITRPYLLKIGKMCKITAGVTILTHDFSYSVLRPVYHSILNECAGYTIIGDNCFLGMNCTIMPGVQLGDNTIVGSGAVVTKSFPGNVVIAGCPAKVVCTLEEFYHKRVSNQVSEACQLACIIRKECGREPTILEMGSFYPLFLIREHDVLTKNRILTNISGDNPEEIVADFFSTSPIFDSFEDFLTYSNSLSE